jgi:Tfp pilus assembly protein PilF
MLRKSRAVSRSLLICGLGFALTAACASRRGGRGETGDTPADKHYKIAVGSFHNGMLEDAKIQLERALVAKPEHADSHYLKGVILLQEGKALVDAIEAERCLTDEAAERQRQRAEDLHRQAYESFAAAMQHFGEEAAGRGRALNSMSVVSLFFHDHDKAIDEARGALRSQFYTERYSALANLGWAYYRKGDLVEATTELRQSVLLNDDYCVGRYRLAQVYLDNDRAEQALEEAVAVVDDPRCPIQDAHLVAGVARLRLGMEAEAAKTFESCVKVAPRSCLAADCERLLASASR